MLITQRPAAIHKNVLTQANALIAMRLPAPQDRKAVEEWIKGQADAEEGRAVLASLSRLQRGEGWVSSAHGRRDTSAVLSRAHASRPRPTTNASPRFAAPSRRQRAISCR